MRRTSPRPTSDAGCRPSGEPPARTAPQSRASSVAACSNARIARVARNAARSAVIAGLALGLTTCARRKPLPYAGFVDAPVAAVAAQVPGAVVSVPVREGARVARGAVLARLDSREREAQVAQMQANLDRAKRGLEQAEANLRATTPTVRGATADIARAQATADEARIEYERTERLFGEGAVTRAERDAARARMQEAEASVSAMVASKAATRGKVGAAAAAVADAEAAVESARAALDLAQIELEKTTIVSPFDGIVVDTTLREGEWAVAGTPVATVEDLGETWVRLDVPETDFGRLRIGQPATIHVFAFPKVALRGHVIEIGAEGDFALNRDVKRGHPDIRTFRVRVAFDAPSGDLRPGMTAEVELLDGSPPAAPGGPK